MPFNVRTQSPVSVVASDLCKTRVYHVSRVPGQTYLGWQTSNEKIARIRWIQVYYVSDATAIQRHPRLMVIDPNTTPGYNIDIWVNWHPASTNRFYHFSPGMDYALISNNIVEIGFFPMPDFGPSKDVSVSFRCDDMAAGDSFNAEVCVDEWDMNQVW